MLTPRSTFDISHSFLFSLQHLPQDSLRGCQLQDFRKTGEYRRSTELLLLVFSKVNDILSQQNGRQVFAYIHLFAGTVSLTF